MRYRWRWPISCLAHLSADSHDENTKEMTELCLRKLKTILFDVTRDLRRRVSLRFAQSGSGLWIAKSWCFCKKMSTSSRLDWGKKEEAVLTEFFCSVSTSFSPKTNFINTNKADFARKQAIGVKKRTFDMSQSRHTRCSCQSPPHEIIHQFEQKHLGKRKCFFLSTSLGMSRRESQCVIKIRRLAHDWMTANELEETLCLQLAKIMCQYLISLSLNV